ncbi:MAG: nucleotidyltransferase domain-containing protein [Candidatus Nanoarchaeia archaeon]
MLQKRNDFEIIIALQHTKKHIRQLAQELDLPPSTISRILMRLEEENVVDFTRQGKNKIYFLKHTLEAKQYILFSEHYKFLQAIQEPRLRRICKKLQEITNGELIILFGSFANNTQKTKSDIDIYVETQESNLRSQLQSIDQRLSIQIGFFEKSSALAQEIIKNHVVIQNVERFYSLLQNEIN